MRHEEVIRFPQSSLLVETTSAASGCNSSNPVTLYHPSHPPSLPTDNREYNTNSIYLSSLSTHL
jgi:hypothetical protein